MVEVDGWEFHKTRAMFESDRRKDMRLQLADCRVLRVTQPRIQHEPQQLADDALRLLSAAREAASDR